MTKKVVYMILINFLIISFISCNSQHKCINKINKIEISAKLKSELIKDQNCFFETDKTIKKNMLFEIYVEKIDDDTIIHVSESEDKIIGNKCLGIFFLDSVTYCIYGLFLNSLYKNDGFYNFEEINLLHSSNSKNKVLSYSEPYTWHYKFQKNEITYFIKNTICE